MALRTALRRWRSIASGGSPAPGEILTYREQLHGQRRRPKTEFVRRIYRAAETALWALAAAAAVVAAIAISDAPRAQARLERAVAAEIAGENREFCARRGLAAESHAHLRCTIELNEVRERHLKRLTVPF
jgi:hypothetical protein